MILSRAMKNLRNSLLFLLLFGHALCGQAATLLLPMSGTTAAAGYLQRLDDPQGVLTPEQALRSGDWQALPSSLSAGFSSTHIWLRVQVRPQGEGEQRWMLRLSNALLDEAYLYQRDGHGGWREQRSGEDLARDQWPVDYRSPVFPLELQGGEPEVLLLRLQSKNALSVSLDFSPRYWFAEFTRREFLGYGLYFGVYLMLIGFHSVFWRLTRAPESGWYLMYVGCCVWMEALTVGLPQQLLGIPVWLSDPLLGVAMALGLPIGAVFASRQLALAQVYGRLTRLLTGLTWLVGGSAALAILLGFYRDAIPVVLLLSLALIPVFIALATWLLLRGHRPARFYLLAFGIYYAGVVIAYLRNFGVLPAAFWTDHAVMIGTLLHMGIMSLRIISHYNRLKRDKAEAQRQTAELMLLQNARLESLVQVRTHELNEELQRRERLEHELRAALSREQGMREEQSDFVAMVSHEFRTPLAIIRTSAQQLSRQLDAPLEKSQRRCQNISDAGARLLALVDDYLTHDRMADARPTSRFVTCDLAALLEGLLVDFPPGRILLDQRLCADGYWCDAGLLHVAVRNLLANADRHAPADAQVRLVVREEGDLVLLSVSHPGALIAEDERGRLFHKYYRGRPAQSSAGAGLGLYMVRRIAQLHGGDVTLVGYGGEEDICFRLHLVLSALEPGPLGVLPGLTNLGEITT
jgi:signal transduction histidine kinase